MSTFVIDEIGFDTDDNLVNDMFIKEMDIDGDCIPDTIVKSFDYNQDGVIDSMSTFYDIDGDGYVDMLIKSHDSTGDGVLNHNDIYINHGNSPLYIPNDLQFEVNSHTDGGIMGTYVDELENYDPSFSNPDLVSGDPLSSMDVWECQGETNRCALYAQKFVIEELTGRHIEMDEFVKVAEENGWFSEAGGTPFLNMCKMIDAYKLEHTMSFHCTINDIEICLGNGGKVIVSIDANEIWYGEDDNLFSPSSSANHAVQVIAINRTNPNSPMVVLNDSGHEGGKGAMIPMDVFLGAWEDGNCQMIECYKKIK